MNPRMTAIQLNSYEKNSANTSIVMEISDPYLLPIPKVKRHVSARGFLNKDT